VGANVGVSNWITLELLVGSHDGRLVSSEVVSPVGWLDGSLDGSPVGCLLVGSSVGLPEGSPDGSPVGAPVGCPPDRTVG
jgi:hypothetical protein